MLNHKRPKQTSWSYSDERGGFVIESLEDIERGEQVIYIYYFVCILFYYYYNILYRYMIVMVENVIADFY